MDSYAEKYKRCKEIYDYCQELKKILGKQAEEIYFTCTDKKVEEKFKEQELKRERGFYDDEY